MRRSADERGWDPDTTFPQLSPDEAIETIEVPEGYHLEVVASEPMVQEPVMMAFGPDGALYVCEWRTYMQDEHATGQMDPVSRVVKLVDTDGDPTKLIPLLMEAGVDTLWPIERASDVSPQQLRREFGKELRLWGGVDKRELAKDKAGPPAPEIAIPGSVLFDDGFETGLGEWETYGGDSGAALYRHPHAAPRGRYCLRLVNEKLGGTAGCFARSTSPSSALMQRARARPRATRCRCPPESWEGRRSNMGPSSRRSATATTRRWVSADEAPRMRRPKARLSRTFMCG